MVVAATPTIRVPHLCRSVQGMSDLQYNLNFKRETDGTWSAWTGMRCHTDTATNWNGRRDSNTQYSTVKVPSDSTPTC